LGIPHVERVGEFTPVPEFPHRAKKVDAGIDHSLILTTDNNIYGAGNNKFGNLGLGHTYSSDSFLLVHGLATNLKFKEI
jgi:alpha-tubulin suppressor-like RCC1 family protein